MKKKVVITVAILILVILITCGAIFVYIKLPEYKIKYADETTNKAEENFITQDEPKIKIEETASNNLIEINGEIKYKITATNSTENDVKSFQLLDILPYNDTLKKHTHNGEYIVTDIEITQKKANKPFTNENLNLYASISEDVRNNINAKDSNLGKTSIWFEPIIGESINRKLTAIAITGILKSQSSLEILITIKTSGNTGKDIYKNTVTAQIEKEDDELKVESSIVKVISRKAEGKIWLDANENGIIDNEETYLENVKASLISEDNNNAKNVLGDDIPFVLTDEKGYYKFENFASGKYKIKIEYGTGIVTIKEADNKDKINSKFNENDETDLFDYTMLDNPEINIENVNAGIIKKKTKVEVKHIEKDTNKILAEETIEGIVKEEYKTKRKEIENYQKVEPEPENKEGKMTVDSISVTYYYEKIPANVIIKYLNEDGTEINARDIEEHKVGDWYKTRPKEIIGYSFDRTVGTEEGNLTKEGAEINYFYKTKKSKVIIKHIEKNTNSVLYEEKIEGKVGEKYEAFLKDIAGYKKSEESRTNCNGTYLDETIIERFYYEKIPAQIEIKYLDESGIELQNKEIIKYNVGDNYKTNAKYIKGYEIKKISGQEEGIITGNIQITYKYKKIEDKNIVYVLYLDKNTNTILDEEIIKGNINENYITNEKQIKNYKTIQDKPLNATGQIKEEPTYVLYYYEKIPAKVTTAYIDENGNTIETSKVENKNIGDKYITHPKDIANYSLENVTGVPEGTIIADAVTVTYQYKKENARLVVRYLEEGTNKILASEDSAVGKINNRYRIVRKEIANYKSAGDNIETLQGVLNKDVVCETYYYEKIPSKVIIKYVAKENEDTVLNEKTIEGFAGDKYLSEKETLAGYKLVEEEPKNIEGFFAPDVSTVILHYEEAKKGKVKVKFLEIGTEEELETMQEIEGAIGETYIAEPKTIRDYNLIDAKIPENKEGAFKEEDTIVTFYYMKKAQKVELTNENDENSNDNIGEIKNTVKNVEKKRGSFAMWLLIALVWIIGFAVFFIGTHERKKKKN